MGLTRRSFGKSLVVGITGASALALIDCGTPSTLITLLNDLIMDGSTLVDIAFPQFATLLSPWVSSLTTFVDETTTELASTDTVAMKFAAITKFAAAIIAPVITGLPSEVVTRISAISQLVPQIVTLVQQLQAEAIVYPNQAQAFFAKGKVKTPSQKNLEKVRKANEKLKAKLAQHRAEIEPPKHPYETELAAGGVYQGGVYIQSPLMYDYDPSVTWLGPES